MTPAERELLVYLGATIAREFDEPGAETAARIMDLLERVCKDRASEMRIILGQPNEERFMAAVRAFLENWGDLALHNRNAAALFREMRIILGRPDEKTVKHVRRLCACPYPDDQECKISPCDCALREKGLTELRTRAHDFGVPFANPYQR